MKNILAFGVFGAALFCAAGAQASEGGAGAYPNGAEALAIATLPPPGQYLLNYTNYYGADRLNDARGNSTVPGFSIDAYAQVGRFVNVTDKKIFGATWAQQVFVSAVDLTVHAAGRRDSRIGIGDIIVDPIVLGWTKGNWNFVAALDTWVPVGRYNKDNLANIGNHYWTFEPVFAASYATPKGGPEMSVKLMYDFNTKNRATDYLSGQYFHTDFSASYNFNPITVGLSGYYLKQTTDDRQGGEKVGLDGNRGETLALGPVIRYQLGKVPIAFQWQHEVLAHNRPQGDKLWLKVNVRL